MWCDVWCVCVCVGGHVLWVCYLRMPKETYSSWCATTGVLRLEPEQLSPGPLSENFIICHYYHNVNFLIDCLRKEKENVCYNKLLNQGTLAILYYHYYLLLLLLGYGPLKVIEPNWNHHISYVNIRNCYSSGWKTLYFVLSTWFSLCM